MFKAGSKNVLLTITEAKALYTDLEYIFEGTAGSTYSRMSDYLLRGQELECTAPVEAPVPVWATIYAASSAGSTIAIKFSKDMADPAGLHADFSVEATAAVTLASAYISAYTPTTIYLTTASDLSSYSGVEVAYSPGTVTSTDGGVLKAFSDFPVDTE